MKSMAAEVKRAKNNAWSTISRWKTANRDMYDLIKQCDACIGKYDDATMSTFGIKVRESDVNGLGVFAIRHFEENTCMGFLTRKFATKEETEARTNYTFTIPGYNDVVVDMYNVASANFTRFINSNVALLAQDANVTINWYGPIGALVSTQIIFPNEELLLDYEL